MQVPDTAKKNALFWRAGDSDIRNIDVAARTYINGCPVARGRFAYDVDGVAHIEHRVARNTQ